MSSAQHAHASTDESGELPDPVGDDRQMAMDWMMRWSIAANANRRMMVMANQIVKTGTADQGESAIQIMAAGEYNDTEKTLAALRGQVLRELADELAIIGRGQVSVDWLRKWLRRRAADIETS